MTPDEYNQKQIDQGELRGGHLTELTLLWQETYNLKEDGFCGPLTLLNPRAVAPFLGLLSVITPSSSSGAWFSTSKCFISYLCP